MLGLYDCRRMNHVDALLAICCSRDIAAINEVSSILQQELKKNVDEVEVTSRKNAEMTYVLSMAIPTLKDLLNSVSRPICSTSGLL